MKRRIPNPWNLFIPLSGYRPRPRRRKIEAPLLHCVLEPGEVARLAAAWRRPAVASEFAIQLIPMSARSKTRYHASFYWTRMNQPSTEVRHAMEKWEAGERIELTHAEEALRRS